MLLRIAIILLIGAHLLVPPGMCVCQFVPRGCGDSGAARAAASSTNRPRSSASCCCGRKRQPVVVSDRVDRAGAEARSSAADGLHEDEQPEQSHLPMCPALRPADHSRIASTPDPLLRILAILAHAACIETPFPRPTPILTDAFAARGAERPLYLSFRTFLI
jgi:hypothetical protein